MSDNVTSLETPQPTRKPRAKPATLVLYLEDGTKETYELKDEKDWSVLFDDVLEIKVKDGRRIYLPMNNNVKRWEID